MGEPTLTIDQLVRSAVADDHDVLYSDQALECLEGIEQRYDCPRPHIVRFLDALASLPDGLFMVEYRELLLKAFGQDALRIEKELSGAGLLQWRKVARIGEAAYGKEELYVMAAALVDREEYDEADRYVELLVQIDDMTTGYNALSVRCAEGRRRQKAERQAMEEHRRGQAFALLREAVALRAENGQLPQTRYRLAIDYLRQATEIDRENPDLYIALAGFYQELHAIEDDHDLLVQAALSARRAMELDPKSREYRHEFASVMFHVDEQKGLSPAVARMLRE